MKTQKIKGGNTNVIASLSKEIEKKQIEEQYRQLMDFADRYFKKGEYEKAKYYLSSAREIKDSAKIDELLKVIIRKQIEKMRVEFNVLTEFVKGEASNNEKLEKCREFLNIHQNIPEDNEKTLITSETSKYIVQLETGIKADEDYQNLLNAAREYIKNKDYPKAVESLDKAKKNRGRDTVETAGLFKEIEEKQIAAMKDDFKSLKKFLAGGATNKEKIEKCRDFLVKHQNTPGSKKNMVDETNRFISGLYAEIKANEQYQGYIVVVKNLIESGDYEKAQKELNKARKIKDTDEVNRLSAAITAGLEKERRNGENEYRTIKDKLTLNQYLAFQRNYPQSVHLPELRDRLKRADKNLPPGNYWDEAIRKNEKGYYEITFGKENNYHLMIYIPEKKIWIDKYEVSWAQYRKFLKEAKIAFSPITDDKIIHSGDTFPAVVTFKDAQSYCRSYGFKLPGAAEWEYAAGKGTSIYPWGNESPDENGNWRANCDSLEGIVEKDGFKGTAPVKSFEKFSSPFGIVNMSGNVWEWVEGNILKGGGFFSSNDDLKIKSFKPGNSDEEGFRCVKLEK